MAVFTIVSTCLLLPHFGIVGAGVARLSVQTLMLLFTVPKLVQRAKMRNVDVIP
jgi:O-antigen/teichoic acid export membrane protein